MTVICWDGKTLAGDKMSTFENTPASTRKVFRAKRNGEVFLFGCAWDSGDCQAYARWARGGERPATFKNLIVLAINQEREVWCAEESLNWYRIGAKQWAVGCGANYALGAMGLGASARKAVQIASKFDVKCGLGVDVVRF